MLLETPSFKEDHISQIPALQLLINLGYKYISPEEALKERQGKFSNVILENILEHQLREINSFTFRGKTYQFANKNISTAIDTIKHIPYDSLIRTNEQVYALLLLGKSFEENIHGNFKSFNLNYIDWDNPDKNVFHVTEEYQVEKIRSQEHRRPDIVIFVNGIPFGVIECKRPDLSDPLKQAISQQLRNQKEEEIPNLFIYTQMLMAISKNEAKYATVTTPTRFWSVWKDRDNIDNAVNNLINRPVPEDQKNELFNSRYKYVRKYFDAIERDGRLPTEQDRGLYCLCRPERLLEFTRRFIIFETGHKKIARYQQYYAVNNTLERVKNFEEPEKRQGGVIWHTQGSGKSLTMVMIAKSLAIDPRIENPRVVIVTDRIDLDDQIFRTFKHCGMEPVKSNSGRDLLEKLEKNKKEIITAVIHKFEAGLNTRNVKIKDSNIFVLVDESHRSQYGTAHAKMRRVLPNACYIGFTGTPLMKSDKNTALKFGGFIEPKYTIDQAVKDKAVVPLLYEGRHVLQEVNQKPIDIWFERICRPLSDKQKADLKRKYSKIDKLNISDQKIYMVAYDISEHYRNNWQGSGFKAQLATPSRVVALKYKKYLDEIGFVSSEVVISSPDDREGEEDTYKKNTEDLQEFWKTMMRRFGSEQEYNRQLTDAFKSDGNPEILIVVDKLLTGFDAPRNTVLYLARSLREHNLLQAVARVNRVYEGKDFGYIVDYFGVLGELDKALDQYSALEKFDIDDIKDTLINIKEEVGTLSQKHSEVWDIFKEISNRKDEEEYEQLLFDEELRKKFYEKLHNFTKTMGIALSVPSFYEDNDEKKINDYKNDLKFFQKLRASVKQRYAESIDFKEYESKIMKLMDTYIASDEVIRITKLVNIMDRDQFEKEVTRIEGKVARADVIAHRTRKTITEKFEEDPVFYGKFSKLLEDAINDYRAQRVSDADYYNSVSEVMEAVREHKDTGIPKILEHRDAARAFYGVIHLTLKEKTGADNEKLKDVAAEIGIGLDDIILKHRIVDWHLNPDIQNKMLNEIEDYLADQNQIDLSYDEIDLVMEKVMNIAKKRYAE